MRVSDDANDIKMFSLLLNFINLPPTNPPKRNPELNVNLSIFKEHTLKRHSSKKKRKKVSSCLKLVVDQ